MQVNPKRTNSTLVSNNISVIAHCYDDATLTARWKILSSKQNKLAVDYVNCCDVGKYISGSYGK